MEQEITEQQMEQLRKNLESLERGQSEIKHQMKSTDQTLGKIEYDLRELMYAIEGSSGVGVVGMAERVKILEAFMNRQEKIFQKIMGAGTIVGILWTLLLKFWDQIFK